MRRRTPAPPFVAALAVGVLIAGTLVGCGGQENPGPSAGPPSAGTADFPVTVGAVTLDQRPTHIVSLAPTGTEMLYAIGAGDQVVAVDDQSDYPADAPRTDLSGVKPNAEAIAAYHPDLVVISNDLNNITSQLTTLKIPVYLASAAKTLDDTYRELTELGTLTGHPDEAASEVTHIKDSIAKLVADVPRRDTPLTYYYELDDTYYSVTSKTFVGSLFSMLGMTNIADPADADGKAGGYPQLSAEAIIGADPDMIFLADTKCCHQSLATVQARPGWSALSAVTHGRVVALDDDIASRWGPRVVDLVKEITDAVAQVPVT